MYVYVQCLNISLKYIKKKEIEWDNRKKKKNIACQKSKEKKKFNANPN